MSRRQLHCGIKYGKLRGGGGVVICRERVDAKSGGIGKNRSRNADSRNKVAREFSKVDLNTSSFLKSLYHPFEV